jgi:cell division septum initiation protein DivIVA|tara:strand:+ start:248 stop:430 length:183 start_codon:yes stop_codon:yes gene_type:complete
MINLKKRYEVLMDKNKRLSFRISELEEEILKLKKDKDWMKENHQAEMLETVKKLRRALQK